MSGNIEKTEIITVIVFPAVGEGTPHTEERVVPAAEPAPEEKKEEPPK
jgi:hypothetical protein